MSKASLDAIIAGINKYQELQGKALNTTVGKEYREYSVKAPHKIQLSIKDLSIELDTLITSEKGLNLKTISNSKIQSMAKVMVDNIIKAAEASGYTYNRSTNEIIVSGNENNYRAVSRLFNKAYGGTTDKAYGPVFDFIIQELSKSSAYSDEIQYIEQFKIDNNNPKSHKIGFDVGHIESNISAAIKATIWNTLKTNSNYTDLRTLSDKQKEEIEAELSKLESDFFAIVNNPVSSNILYRTLKRKNIIKSQDELSSIVKDFGEVTFSFVRKVINGQLHADIELETEIKNLADLKHIAEEAYVAVKPEFSKYNQQKGAEIEAALGKHFKADSRAFSTVFKNWLSGQKIPGMPPLPKLSGSPTLEDMAADQVYTSLKFGKNNNDSHTSKTKQIGKASVNKAKGIKVKLQKSNSDIGKVDVPIIQPLRSSKGKFVSLVNVVNLINLKLADRIRSNMGSPRLNYRTGRFSESAKVLPATIDKDGAIRLPYTYQKFPYQTFEVGFEKGSPSRDPRPLISGSIRELAVKEVAAKLRIVRV